VAATAGAVSATAPGFFGGGPGQGRFNLTQHLQPSRRNAAFFGFANKTAGHFALTERTSIVSPFNVPVTVAFLPACLSSVFSAS
jgi:hypothetical protein